MADETKKLPPQAVEMLRKMYDAGESEEDIKTVIDHFQQQPQTFWEKHPNLASVARSTIDALPALGGALGFTLGSGSGVGAVPGAVAGAALGRTVRNPLMAATGLEAPKSPLTTMGEAVTDAALQGAMPGISKAKGIAKEGIKEVPGAVVRLARQPLVSGGAGAALGGWEGYKYGGIPGAAIGATVGGVSGMSPRINPLLRTLGASGAPEAEAATVARTAAPRTMSEMPVKVGAARALDLSRKAVLSSEEVQELKTLLANSSRQASEVGMIHAAAGKVE